MADSHRKRAVQTAVDKDELRAGAMVHADYVRNGQDNPAQQGLRLQPSQKVRIEDLQESPHNRLFDAAKSEEYWNELRTDILNAGAIIEPLVATKDNVLISGHSRLRIARDLVAEGRHEFSRIPVCYVVDELSDDERRNRVYRSNLLRFEVDEDLRIQIHSELYPTVYQSAPKGRRAADSDTETLQEIAMQSGLSTSTIKRETRIFRRAMKRAERNGRDGPDKSDYQEARADENKGRQKATPSKKQSSRKPSRAAGDISSARLNELADQFIADRGTTMEGSVVRDFVDFVVARTAVNRDTGRPKS